MLIAQITDCHVRADRRTAYERVDTAGFLEAAVDHVNAFRPSIDAVIVSGDLTDRGSPEDYAAVAPILTRLAMPWFAVPGNHDHRANLRAALPAAAVPGDGGPFVQFTVDDLPLRLVGLDTTMPGQPYGEFCADRLAWLDAALAAAPDRPTLVFMHHPPFVTGIGHMDVQRLQNPEALFAVLRKHRQVRHVACGHVHRAIETTIDGIGVSIAPNAAHSVTLDLVADAPSTFTMEPPALRLFRYDDSGLLTTQISHVGRFDGPHPFFRADGELVG